MSEPKPSSPWLNPCLFLASGILAWLVGTAFHSPEKSRPNTPGNTAPTSSQPALTYEQKLDAAMQKQELTESALYGARETLLEWAARDRIAAVRWLMSRNFPWDTLSFCKQLLKDAKSHEVKGLLATLTPGLTKFLESELMPVLLSHPDLDMHSRIAWLESAETSSSLLAASVFTDKNSLTDPDALAWLTKNAKELWLPGAISQALLKMDDPGGLWNTAATMENKVLQRIMQEGIIQAMVRVSPLRAAAQALNITDFSTRRSALNRTIWKWADSDAAGAAAWLKANLQGVERNRVISETLMLQADHAPREFLALMDELPSQSLQDTALTYASPRIPSDLSPAAAMEFASGWDSRKMAARALQGYALGLAKTDPAEATNMVRSESFPDEARISTLTNIVLWSGGSLNDVPERVTRLAGDLAPAVAEAILFHQKQSLSLEAKAALTVLTSRTDAE